MGLVGDFAQLDEAQWRKLAEAALKGGSIERLASKVDDAMTIAPIYAAQSGPRPVRDPGDWTVMARVDHPDAKSANAQALEDLAGGAGGLDIVFAGSGGAYGYGLAKFNSASLHAALDGVRFDDDIHVELDLGPDGEAQALAVAALIERSGFAPAQVDLSFGLDPISALARTGRASGPWSEQAGALAKCVATLRARGFQGPFVAADARVVHAAGGSPVQELAFALASGVSALRALGADGRDLDAARAAIGFRLTADADEFLSLAKFRALRLLWARVEESCGLAARPLRLHGESAWRVMTTRDPYVNVMRGALAAFSAGLGGADAVSVLPFTQALGLPDGFARRLARNTQLVLLDEARLGFVADPAAGAGAFEALTRELCEKAWIAFQALEAQGGLWNALLGGAFQQEVAKTAATRVQDVGRMKIVLTGVNSHPDLREAKVETLPAEKPAVAESGDVVATPLRPIRLAASYETMRDASDATLEATGARPRVFLANFGVRSEYAPRADFSRGVFEAGGIEALGEAAYAEPEDAAAAFVASGAKLACLCSSDEVYAQRGESFAAALKSKGAQWVVQAGKPGNFEAALRAAGVDDFIFRGCNARGSLLTALSKSGVVVA